MQHAALALIDAGVDSGSSESLSNTKEYVEVAGLPGNKGVCLSFWVCFSAGKPRRSGIVTKIEAYRTDGSLVPDANPDRLRDVVVVTLVLGTLLLAKM